MSALDDAKASVIADRVTVGDLLITDRVWDVDIKPLIAKLFWNWFYTHEHVRIVQKKFLIFKVTLVVGDLHSLFELLFGKE